jgi:succinoglycan biosynthesis protein ExoA
MATRELFPYVSIIVPIRNEASRIARTLDCLFKQTYPADRFEIIIAEGSSSDNTREIVDETARKNQGIALSVVDNPGKIVSIGFNLALRRAKGEIIARVDGHTSIAPDYILQCVEVLERTKADNVGGKMNGIGKNTFSEAVCLATSTPFGVGGGRFHISLIDEWVDTVYMGAWPRRVFEKIGLFDEELVRDQDDEFNYRLLEMGGRIFLSQTIHSQYFVRSRPGALYKQYFQYGYWKVRVFQKHPGQIRWRQFIPFTFVVALIVSALLTLLFAWGWFFLAFVSGSYVLANLSASIITAARKGWKHLPFLPPTYGIMHLSYGLGFLLGLARFANRWNDKQGKVPAL